MRLELILVVVGALTLAACSGREAPPAQQPNQTQTAKADAEPDESTKPEVERAGWTTEEVTTEAKGREVLTFQWGAGSDSKRSLLLPGNTADDWRGWNDAQRRRVLESMSEVGSKWAQNVVERPDNGELKPEDLDELADAFAEEAAFATTYHFIGPVPTYDPVEPMPFGDSMFGPWDTGRGSAMRP
ncbi:MAG: hypothetical protein KDB82_06200 [Planctomycetes bacterium]|nr:hypothetical protein [Planctomycetota bacterium]